jgi:hypothetical protein
MKDNFKLFLIWLVGAYVLVHFPIAVLVFGGVLFMALPFKKLILPVESDMRVEPMLGITKIAALQTMTEMAVIKSVLASGNRVEHPEVRMMDISRRK